MPNGFWPAGGTWDYREGIPASSFSKGDPLMFDSSSSLSSIATAFADGVDIGGIAMADSTQSIQNKVPYAIPGDDAIAWASLASGSAATPGTECDILFALANNRFYVDPTSQNSVRCVIVEGTVELPLNEHQSIQSKAIVRFIRHAGNFEF